MIKTINLVYLAIKRCKNFILSVFIAYCISCLVGIVMSQNGNNFALSCRDKIVGRAVKTDKASINYQEGNNFLAALNDFKANLLFGAVPQTLMGFGIVIPYFSVLRQGWVGGIVSVNNSHQSRFKNPKTLVYFFIVLLLQFIPFSISIGAGIKCGIDFFKHNSSVSWKFWNYRMPLASLKDLGYILLLSIPLFFIASCFEFLSSWNIG